MTSEIKVDTISEQTSANGVTIDGLTIKDGNIIGDVALAGTTPTFTIGDGGAEDAALIFDGNALDFYIALDDSADDLVIGTGSTIGSNVKMVIENGGNVGIGTDSIDVSTQAGGSGYRVLQIENDEGGQINLDHNDAGTGSTLGQINFQRAGEVLAEIEGVTDGATDSGKVAFRTQAASGALTERMRIDSNGKVLIGTTSEPQAFGDDRKSLTIRSEGSGHYGVLQISGNADSNDQLLGIVNFYNETTSCSRIDSARENSVNDANLRFWTAPSSGGIAERMRITRGGSIGIGETAPLGLVHIKTADSGATADANADELVIEGTRAGMSILTANNNYGYIVFGDDGGNNRGAIRYGHPNDDLQIVTAASERVLIDTNVKLTGANLVFATAGKGIDFSANTDTGTGESVNDSVLDDYEQGTFTITPTTTGTDFTTSSKGGACFYTKIGDWVYCNVQWFVSTPSGTASSGNFKLTGMPFVCNAGGNSVNGTMASFGRTSTDGTRHGSTYANITDNASEVLLYYQTSGGSSTVFEADNLEGNITPFGAFSIGYPCD